MYVISAGVNAVLFDCSQSVGLLRQGRRLTDSKAMQANRNRKNQAYLALFISWLLSGTLQFIQILGDRWMCHWSSSEVTISGVT